MSTTKPTIVLVPGVFHVPQNYHSLTNALESHGYKVHGVDLPSCTEHPTTISYEDDAVAVREVLTTIADRGEDIFLLMHSFGGILGTEGTKGVLKPERQAQGLKGGVTALFYMCAIIAPENTLADVSGGKIPDNFYLDAADSNICHATDSFVERCFDGLSAHIPEQKPLLRPFSVGCLMSVGSKKMFEPYKVEGVRSTYLFTELDLALTVPMQERILGWVGEHIDVVVRCKSGHSPWLSMPEYTLQAVRRAAGQDV